MSLTWTINLTQNTNLNDSDKTFSVPSNSEWEIFWIWVEYTSTAIAGLRLLEIQLLDGSNTIARWQAGIGQPENTTYKYLFSAGIPDLHDVRDDNYLMTTLLGAAFLKGGQSIRIWDNKVRDPTGDDMIIQMQYGYHGI